MNKTSLVNMLQLENEELKKKVTALEEALYQTEHYILFGEYGWSLSHLVSCRPDMTECEIHQAMLKQEWENVHREGRYKVWLEEDGWIRFEKQINNGGLSEE